MSDEGQRQRDGGGGDRKAPRTANDSNGHRESVAEKFTRLYMDHRPKLVSHARQFCAAADAEDAVHEAFCYHWRSLDGAIADDALLGRLYRTTGHRALNLKLKRDRLELRDPSIFDMMKRPQAGDAASIADALEDVAGGGLGPEASRLISLLLNGLTLMEIAENEHIPLGTVKRRLHTARKKLGRLKNKANLSAP